MSERLERLRKSSAKRRLADQLDEIALHCTRLPVLDERGAEEIMGYHENGPPH
ncbi:MAG TPA: hypothetical protein VHW71_01570 [Steroidobacteraceae bacterium]|nr:hypothetical protein [Steroidobacteraceae bacterium]